MCHYVCKTTGIKNAKKVWYGLFSEPQASMFAQLFYLQKKANLALLQQEQAKAREEALHQEKLREEEQKISEALEESKKVGCVTKSMF